MKKTVRALFAVVFAAGLLLLPQVFAAEGVSVDILKNGAAAVSPQVGDALVLSASPKNAQEGDTVTFALTGETLAFKDTDKAETTVAVKDGTAEAAVSVKKAGPIDIRATVTRTNAGADAHLTAYEKPEKLVLTANKVNARPGDRITVTAALTPEGKTNAQLLRGVTWEVYASGAEIETDNTTGEEIGFTVPDNAAGKKILVSAVLPQDGAVETELTAEEVCVAVSEDNPHAAIYCSTDTTGIVKGKDIGFSSEVFTGGGVSEKAYTEGAKYTWTARLDSAYIDEKQNGTTFSVCPDKPGTLSVQLSVSLKDGTTLTSAPIVKNITDGEAPLETVTIRMKSLAGSDAVQTGDSVSFTSVLSPKGASNLDEAAYEWKVEQNGTVIKKVPLPNDLWLAPEAAGPMTVTLTVTPKGGKAIVSNTLRVNVTEKTQDAPEAPLIKAEILTDTKTLTAGESAVFTAGVSADDSTLQTELEGKETRVYRWSACTADGSVLAQGEGEKFVCTPEQAGPLTITLDVDVSGQSAQAKLTAEVEKTDSAVQKPEESAKPDETVKDSETLKSEGTEKPDQTAKQPGAAQDEKNGQVNASQQPDETVKASQTQKPDTAVNAETPKQADAVKTETVKQTQAVVTEKPKQAEAVQATEQAQTQDVRKENAQSAAVQNAAQNPAKTSAQNTTVQRPNAVRNTNNSGTAQQTVSATVKATPKQAAATKTIVNPKTGVELTSRELLALGISTAVIVAALLFLLFRRRHNNRNRNFYL